MAWIVGDSFDYYGSTTDLARSVWDSNPSANFNFASGAVTRFGVGQCMQPTSGAGITVTKTIGSNEATLYAAVAYYRIGALSGTTPEFYFQFRDGATPQCTVVFESSGNIVLKRGDHTGTVVATYTAAFPQDVWTHFQVRVVIDPTIGSLTVRKNGVPTDTFTATGLNTRSTANSYATVIAVGTGGAAGNPFRYDDVCFFSGSGAAPNTWVGDVRAVCLVPSGDTAQKNFAPLTATATTTTGTTSTNATCATNTIRFGAFVPVRSGTVTNATLTFASAYTGSAQVALYAADGAGGLPGTLLGTSAVLTNPASGVNNLAFSAGPSLALGRTYWFAYNSNIVATQSITNISAAGTAYYQAQPYASGFPSPATALVGAGPGGTGQALFSTLTLSGNVTQVSEQLANGDTDYVFSATVNDADLYDCDDLPASAQTVIGVVTKVYCKKSDAGARQGQVLVKSGATQVAGTDTVLSSTYTYLSRADMVDPATGIAWTIAGVNAVQIGQKVTA